MIINQDLLKLAKAVIKSAEPLDIKSIKIKPIQPEPVTGNNSAGIAGGFLDSVDNKINNAWSAGNNVTGGFLDTVYGKPSLNSTGGQRLWENRGNIVKTVGQVGLADKAIMKGLGHISSGSTASLANAAARLAPQAMKNTVRFGARGLGGLAGGPAMPLITAGMELHDIARHGYNIDDFRQQVTPDGTVLGVNTYGPISYLGSSLNSVGNPIRSADLFARDTAGLLGAVPGRPSLVGAIANHGTSDNWRNMIQKRRAEIADKANRLGYSGLSPGEKADLITWDRRNYRQTPSIWEQFGY